MEANACVHSGQISVITAEMPSHYYQHHSVCGPFLALLLLPFLRQEDDIFIGNDAGQRHWPCPINLLECCVRFRTWFKLNNRRGGIKCQSVLVCNIDKECNLNLFNTEAPFETPARKLHAENKQGISLQLRALLYAHYLGITIKITLVRFHQK